MPPAHTLGRRLQQTVANGMSERIVDVLEMVEIETQHRDGFGTPQVIQDRAHPFIERHAVRQVRERIEVRQVLDLLLGEKPFGDILEGNNEAPARHGPI